MCSFIHDVEPSQAYDIMLKDIDGAKTELMLVEANETFQYYIERATKFLKSVRLMCDRGLSSPCAILSLRGIAFV